MNALNSAGTLHRYLRSSGKERSEARPASTDPPLPERITAETGSGTDSICNKAGIALQVPVRSTGPASALGHFQNIHHTLGAPVFCRDEEARLPTPSQSLPHLHTEEAVPPLLCDLLTALKGIPAVHLTQHRDTVAAAQTTVSHITTTQSNYSFAGLSHIPEHMKGGSSVLP